MIYIRGIISSAYDLDKCGHWKEASESFSFLIFLVTPMGLQSVQLPSNVGHDTQERSFLTSRARSVSNKEQMTQFLIRDALKERS